MTARTHDLAAITALAAVAIAQPVKPMTLATILISVLANQLGGIAPDIDQPTAPFWRNLPAGKVFGKVLDRMLGGHRFLTHSLLGLAAFGWALHWLLNLLHPVMPHVDVGIVWWSFMIGMASHLLMDMLTKEGVPLLLPIPIKFGIPPLKSLRITTGKIAEKIIFLVILIGAVWLCARGYTHLQSLFHSIS